MTRKIMVVTGGSRGIGAATCRLAALDGYDICFSYVANSNAAAKTVAELEALGARAIAVKSDVGVEADVVRLFEDCDQHLGRVDALINNAGIIGNASRVDGLEADVLRRVFEVNVYGTFWCAREAVKRMSTAQGGQGGAIVNVSSIAATNGSPGEYVHYAASKGAIDTFSIGLAKEVGREGIRVNSCQAGTADTDIHAMTGNPDRPAMVARTSALGRVATPEDIAEALIWLASEKSSYATGSILRVGGGL